MNNKLKSFIERAKIKHGGKYDYSLVDYKNNKTKIKILCPKHGVFEQAPNNHLKGNGCPSCSGNKKLNTSEFIEKAIEIHGNKYDYSFVEYKNSNTKIKILCNECRTIFLQKPSSHLEGYNCKKCSDNLKKSNTLEFIQKSTLIHGDQYDYSSVEYINNRKKIKISCKLHGIFDQRPYDHLSGKGCPKCGYIISSLETKWLDSLGITIRQHKIPGTNFIVDGYDPDTNTCYEFHGDIWHGNPNKYSPLDINPINKKQYGHLYKNTAKKEKRLKKMGYNVISIWEDDFKKINSNIQSHFTSHNML